MSILMSEPHPVGEGYRTKSHSILRGSVALAVALIGAILLAMTLTPQAKAVNGVCLPQGAPPYYDVFNHCVWSSNPHQPGAMVYMNVTPGNNQRTWFGAWVTDGHSGNVAAKCIGIKSMAGATLTLACGNGSPYGQIEGEHPAYQPGYLWTWHNAPGPRTINGHGQYY